MRERLTESCETHQWAVTAAAPFPRHCLRCGKAQLPGWSYRDCTVLEADEALEIHAFGHVLNDETPR
jgi:hypothetical protein